MHPNLLCTFTILASCALLLAGASTETFMHEVKYDVQLSVDVPATVIAEDMSSTVEMYSKYGQKFTCQLPLVKDTNLNAVPPLINNSYIASLLSKLDGSDCLQLTRGWWTYELCYKRHILQYREENNQRISEILLGRFDSETNWDMPDRNLTEDKPFFHSQHYVNGSICDITFKQRRVEVRYSCGEDDSFGISNVEEVETCVYRMDVSAPTLCSHPSFVAHAPLKVEPILCVPVVLPIDVAAAQPVDSEKLQQHMLYSDTDTRRPRSSRPLTLSNIYKNMRVRRRAKGRRVIRRHLREFFRTLTAPVPVDAKSGLPVAFADYARVNRFRPVSFAVALEESELKLWANELIRCRLMLSLYSYESFLQESPEAQAFSPKSVAVINSLGSLVYALAKSKLTRFTYPEELTVNYPYERFAAVTEVYLKICKELVENQADVELGNLASEVLLTLYSEYDNSDPLEYVDLHGINPNSDKIIRIRPREFVRTSSALNITPAGAAKLYFALKTLEHRLRYLKLIQKNMERTATVSAAETELESTIQQFLADTKFKVLMVRGIDKRDVAGTDETNTDSHSPILSIIKSVLKKVSPEGSRDVDVYETGNSAGVSTFLIVSSEEKGKEERRMTKLEKTYKFTTPSSKKKLTES
ncbi:hypothetical protein EG68_09680 [Paragonimus skrjabini miyazakii]|uniref:MRH domain-containing protein n=1 Tax=Paragonimus skrjabini miyazakii TaxID=59628 RepID=A0A8S9YDN5_9TREM|nr:hypothetical protein EG68_09680 [Paragonimus skrjabini miyazakii]